MGFSIEVFFDELFEVLNTEGNARGKFEELKERINLTMATPKNAG